MLQHYFHSSYNLRSNRRNLHQFRMSTKNPNNQSTSHICLSNGNAIEIYKVSSQSVDLCIRKQFMCNIVKVEVVPSLHHDNDFIFILDDLGRYTFWRPNQGMRQTSNIIREEDVKKRYYREQLSPQEEEHFAGSTFHFDVKDTVGHIFFTIQNKLTILKVSVKAKQGLKIQNMRTYEIPYTRFRFMNCLDSVNSARESEIIIGIVQQIEQKTILKFHALDLDVSSIRIDEESLSFKIQKVNILQFSSGENDQIILLSYDQISLYRYKNGNLCNYRTKGNYGSCSYVPPFDNKRQGVYVNLGYEVIVFTKSKLRNYGGLKLDNKSLLQNRGILQSKYLGRNNNGQVVIGFISTFNEVYFVVLREQKWSLLRKIESLSSIFSINQVVSNQQSNSSLVVVHSSSESCSEVSLVEISTPSVLEFQQCIEEKVIENIEVVEDGESLVVSYSGESSLLTWSKNDKKWVEHYSFNHQNKEQVLACRGMYIVMRSGIYKYQITATQQQSHQAQKQQQQQSLSLTLTNKQSPILSTTLLIKQENILSAVCNQSYIGYYTSEGTFKFFELKSQSISRMRKNCVEEYLWHMVEGYDVMVSAAYTEMGELRILPVDKAGTKITLHNKQLVSSIASISYTSPCLINSNSNKMQVEQQTKSKIMVDLILGYHNGQVQVYSLQENRMIQRFNIGNEMVRLTAYRRGHVIVYSNEKQFILSRQQISRDKNDKNNKSASLEYKLHQVGFIQDNPIQSSISQLVYLPKFDKFLLALTNNNINITSNDNIYTINNQSFSQTHNKPSTILQLRTLKLSHSLSNRQLSLQLNSSLSLKTLFRAQSSQTIPYTEIYNNQYLFIAVSQNIFKYSLKTKSLLKHQLHLLKQVVSINSIKAGIIVAGVDFIESGSIYLFDYQDLSIKSTYSMGPSSKPSSLQTLKSPSSNKFLIRHQTFISIFQLQSNGLITLIKSINTKTQGSSIQLNEDYNKILLTDPYRYLSVWDYDLNNKDILPVSKYFGPYMINDTTWLDGAVVTGDRGGNLTILQFNLNNQNDLHKMAMTKVGQISIGEEIFTLKRSQHYLEQSNQQNIDNTNKDDNTKMCQQNQFIQSSTVYYGTSCGTIGLLRTIKQQQFKLLKQIQIDALKYIELKEQFSYEQWRKRVVESDKLIDSSLIGYYLEEFKSKVKPSQEEFYCEVRRVYEGIMSNKKTR